MNTIEKEIRNKVEIILTTLVMNQNVMPLGLTLLDMEIVVTKDLPFNAPAGWKSGYKVIYLNETINQMNNSFIRFVLCHEVLHYMLLHDIRGSEKEHLIWNMAGDYMINRVAYELLSAASLAPSLSEVTSEGLWNDKYKNWIEEEIYEDLLKQSKKLSNQFQPDGDSNENVGSWSDGNIVVNNTNKDPSPPQKSDKQSEKSNELSHDRLLANQRFKQHIENLSKGEHHHQLEKLFNKLISTEVNWKVILQNSIVTVLEKSTELNWSRPRTSWLVNRHTLPYLPNFDEEEKYGTIVISIDESGSMCDDDVAKGLDIVYQSKEFYKNIYLIRHDHSVTSSTLYESKEIKIDDINFRESCGGTSHEDVFDEINKFRKHNLISLYIGITDLESDIEENIDKLNGIPKIWITPQDTSIKNIGQIIIID